MDDKIRITELTATIDYYYSDGTIYLQKFFTNATLPAQIQQGQTSTLYIPFSLPTNIASGYTSVEVKAKTELAACITEGITIKERSGNNAIRSPFLYIFISF